MVSQDYFRQLSPELFYIHANPLRGRHSVQRSRGCGEDGREEGTATETAGGLAAAPDSVVEGSTLSGSWENVRKWLRCFSSVKRKVTAVCPVGMSLLGPRKGPHCHDQAWGSQIFYGFCLEGMLKVAAGLCPGARERKTLEAPSTLQRWAELQVSRLSLYGPGKPCALRSVLRSHAAHLVYTLDQ